MDKPPILEPRPETVAKYGMTIGDFMLMAKEQGWACAICKKTPPSGRLVVDHHHHSSGKWKTWPAPRRKAAVRGLLCMLCNRFCVGRGVTVEKARAAVAYLEAFAARSSVPACPPPENPSTPS